MDKKYDCLLLTEGGCQWEGLVTEIVDHFISAHKASYKPHPINVEVDIGTVYQFLTVVFNRVFFVQVKATKSETIECLVKFVYECDAAQPSICEFCIQSDYDNFESSHVGMVYGLNHTENMYLFNFHKNDVTNHLTTKIRCIITNVNNGSNIDLIPTYVHNYSLEKAFENDDTPKPLPASEQRTIASSQYEITTDLEELRCPICLNYKNAPIFKCTVGHSFCQDCKTKLDACPICHTKVINVQKYVLEKLIQKIQHPCKYAQYGCAQILNWENGKQHIDKCLYRPIKCFFKVCDKQDVYISTVGEHFKKVHSAFLFEENQLLEKSVDTTWKTYNATIFNTTQVFVLSFKYVRNTNSVSFDCIHITAEENEWNKYAFELQFVSKDDDNLKFVVNRYCQRKFNFVDPIILPLHALKYFISHKTESKLYFKCLIQKV